MFSAFLSPDMTYSCGIYPTLDADTSFDFSNLSSPSNESVEDGQKVSIFPPASSVSQKLNGSDVSLAKRPYEGDGNASNGWKNRDDKDELQEAQMTKLRYIIKKAKLSRGMRVLEIGSGWGSFAIEVRFDFLFCVPLGCKSFALTSPSAPFIFTPSSLPWHQAVRSTGCTVDTLTLSIQQATLARQRIAEAGLTSSITVHLLDYRAIPKVNMAPSLSMPAS